jgi:putative membrane protein
MPKKLIMSLAVATSLAALPASAWAKDSASQAFLKKAIQGNLAETQLGELAQEKGASDGVRSFGQTLATDHSTANEQAMAAAQEMGVTPPKEPTKEKKALYQKLSKLSGEAFDRQFVQAMVSDHKKDIADYQKEAKQKDAAGSYAGDTLPDLQKHLEIAQSLQSGKTQ